MTGRRRRFITVATALLLAAAAGLALLVASRGLGVPAVAAGLAARGLCSAIHVAGRDPTAAIAEDLEPAHPLLRWVQLTADATNASVTASLAGFAPRTARYLSPFGCVLEPSAALIAAAAELSGRQAGNVGQPAREAPGTRLDSAPETIRAALAPVVSAAFEPGRAGGPASAAPNTRAVIVLVNGRLAAERYGPGFDAATPQLGWSMAKTVTALLVHQRLAEQGRAAATTTALAWTQAARRPPWLAAWAEDSRRDLTLGELLSMRDHLDHVEAYAPWSAVPAMLWNETDVGDFAGSVRRHSDAPEFRYASAVTNLLQALLRASFADDFAYWRYASEQLFQPLGLSRARFETDANGTLIGSSFLWASARDWARLAELMRQDGRLGERQLIAPGWLAQASRPLPSATAEAQRYAAHIWRIGEPGTLTCAAADRLPPDALAMLGHWGQLAAILPSRRAVVVRLGWAAPAEAFDRCAFLAAVDRVLALTERDAGRSSGLADPAARSN